jgi:hypothetical protein
VRRKAVGVAFAILVAATLLVSYLAGSSALRTGSSTSTLTSVGLSAFTYQTVLSSTSLSTSYSISGENNITITFASVLTSTVTATWVPGQPIPVSGVETADVPVGGALAIAVNANASRAYVLGTSALTVVDTSSHSAIAKVALPVNNTGGSVNSGLAIGYSSGTIYASVQGEVVEVSSLTNTVVGELPLSLGTLAFDSATHVLWGTEVQAGRLVGVDVETHSIVANVSLGFSPYDVALNRYTHMVYAVGCDQQGLACDSMLSIVNGTSGTLVKTISLQSAYYSPIALNLRTNVVYASSEAQLLALNGTDGSVIFRWDPQTCALGDMAIIPSSNRVLAVAADYDYLLLYDGTSGALLNIYSFPSPPGPFAYNPNTDEIYVVASGDLLSLRDVQATGNVNSTLIGGVQNCLEP